MQQRFVEHLLAVSWPLRVTIGVGIAVAVCGAPHVSRAQAVSGVASPRAFLDEYCVTCHSESQHQRGVVPMSLQGLDLRQVGSRAELWEKVVRKVRSEMMPPLGARRPDTVTRGAWVGWLESELDRAAAAHPSSGRPMTAAHRLNRAEYKQAVRDLIDVDVNIEALLPPDDADAEGFDNNADVLSVSPTLMEHYLNAARRISQIAIGDPVAVSRAESYPVPHLEAQDDRTSDDLPFGTRGGVAVRHHFPLDGEYEFKVDLRRNFNNYIRGVGNTPHQLDLRLDQALVTTFMIGGEFTGERCPASFCGNRSGFEEWGAYSVHADDGLRVRVPIKAGTRLVGVAFVRRPSLDEGVLQPAPSRASYGFSTDEQQDGNPAVARLIITGPFDGRAPIETPSRKKIFICRPKTPAEEPRCVQQILSSLARRAYRRSVATSDLTPRLRFYEAGRRDDGFDAGIQAALEFVLTDPEFVFRIERAPGVPAEVGPTVRVSDVELASRLSFFL